MIASLIKKISTVCLGTAFIGAMGTANATPMFYNNMATFNAAAAGITLSTDSLDSRPTGTLPSSANGITISTTNNGIITASPSYASGHAVHLTTQSSGTGVTFAFSTAINAFAIDVWDLGTVGSTIFTVALSSGGSMVYNLTDAVNGLQSFYGVIDSMTSFTSVTLTNSDGGDVVEFDNVKYGTAPSIIPEPRTLALFGIGLAGLGYARRRRAASPIKELDVG
jgi:hypothetical protein